MSSSNNQKLSVRARHNLYPRNIREVSRDNSGAVFVVFIFLAMLAFYVWALMVLA